MTPRNVFCAAVLIGLVAQPLYSQTTPVSSSGTPPSEEVLVLSVFEVSAHRDRGYVAANAVSATRTNTPIKDLPLSISVLSEEFLQDAAIENIGAVLKWSASNTGPNNPRLRGLAANVRVNGFEGSERDDMVSAQRVEIIKGPGAIMSGSSAPGGLVNVITKRPLVRNALTIAQSFSDRDYLRTDIDANVRANDKFAVRVAAAYVDEGEFATQRAKQTWDDHAREETTIYAVAQWRPTQATTVTADITYLDQNRPFRDQPGVRWDSYGRIAPAAGQTAVYLTEAPFNYPRSFGLSGPEAIDDVENTIFDFEVLHEFSDNLKVKFLVNGRERSRLLVGPASTGLVTANAALVAANPGQGLVVGERYLGVRWNYSEQVNPWGFNYEANAVWTSTIDDLVENKVLFGANTGEGKFWSIGGRGRDSAGVEQRYYFRFGDFNPDTSRPASLNMVYTPRTPESLTTQKNAFVVHQGRWLGGKFHSLAGLFYYRYDDERVTNNVVTTVENTGTNPQIGLVYAVRDWLNLYAIHAKSIQGQNRRNSRGEVLPPFKGTNYEAGFKVETPDGKYSGTISYFKTDFVNRQFNDPTVPDITGSTSPGERVSSGEDESSGLDAEFIFTPKPKWQILLGYAYLDTRVVKDRGDRPERVGQRFNNHAFHNYTLWTSYGFADGLLKGFTMGGGIRGNSGSILEYRTVDGVLMPSEDTTDPYVELFFNYRRPVGKSQLFASVNLKNVTRQDRYQFFKNNSTEPYFIYRNPMEMLVRVGFEF